MLGSMFGVWAISSIVRPIRPYIGIPRWFHVFVVLGIAVLIGAMFSPDTLNQMLNWIITVSAMLVSTIIATAVGTWYLTKRRGYDPMLALFCSIPGGQAEVIIISKELVEKDYVVALCHLVRVVFVFCSVPLSLALIMGENAVRHSNVVLSELPGLLSLPFTIVIQFVFLALAGYLLALLFRIPIPFLIGPMLLSMGLHLSGIVSIPRINEFVLLAQLTIGGAVGARLGQVDFGILASHLRDAIVNVVLVISVFVASAQLLASITGIDFLDVMLAFVPGGLYEVSLLALIFGFDVAFVAVHHSARMLFILFSLPIILKFLPGVAKQVIRE